MSKKLTDDEIWALIQAARGEGPRAIKARNALIVYNLGLARRLAGRIARGHDPEMVTELVHAAVVSEHAGFLRAIAEFDPARGCRFTTPLAWWLRKAMVAALPDSYGAAHARNRNVAIRARAAAMATRMGREPTAAEVQSDHEWRRRPPLAAVEAALQPHHLMEVPWEGAAADYSLGAQPDWCTPGAQPDWHSDGFCEDDMIEHLDRQRRISMVRRAVVQAGDGARELLAGRKQKKGKRGEALMAVAAALPAHANAA